MISYSFLGENFNKIGPRTVYTECVCMCVRALTRMRALFYKVYVNILNYTP